MSLFRPRTANTFAPPMRRPSAADGPVASLLDRSPVEARPTIASAFAGSDSLDPMYGQAGGSPQPRPPSPPESQQSVWRYPSATTQYNDPLLGGLIDRPASAPAPQTPPEAEDDGYYSPQDMLPGLRYTPSQAARRQVDPLLYQFLGPVETGRYS